MLGLLWPISKIEPGPFRLVALQQDRHAAREQETRRVNARRKRANRARSFRPSAEQLNPRLTERITHVMIATLPCSDVHLAKMTSRFLECLTNAVCHDWRYSWPSISFRMIPTQARLHLP